MKYLLNLLKYILILIALFIFYSSACKKDFATTNEITNSESTEKDTTKITEKCITEEWNLIRFLNPLTGLVETSFPKEKGIRIFLNLDDTSSNICIKSRINICCGKVEMSKSGYLKLLSISYCTKKFGSKDDRDWDNAYVGTIQNVVRYTIIEDTLKLFYEKKVNDLFQKESVDFFKKY